MIRRADISDADVLTALALRAKASWGYPDAWLREWALELTFTRRVFDSCTVLVAEDSQSRIMGVAALSLNVTDSQAELEHLWVDPLKHGHGVGRALVEAILDVAATAGIRSIRVESDPGARPFYERLGGKYEGEVAAPVEDDRARTLPVLRLPVAMPAEG